MARRKVEKIGRQPFSIWVASLIPLKKNLIVESDFIGCAFYTTIEELTEKARDDLGADITDMIYIANVALSDFRCGEFVQKLNVWEIV